MNPDSLSANKIKTIALVVLAFIVAMVIIVLLGNYFTKGKLAITTGSDNNSITISKAGTSGQPSGFPKTAKGSITLTLGTGQYVVSVQGNSVASSQIVTVSAHTTSTYNIPPAQVSGVEPVIIGSVSDFAIDNTGVSYLNPNNSKLSVLGPGNSHVELPNSLQFQSVAWADPTFGIAQTIDGDFYVVDHDRITPLKSPVSNDKSNLKEYAVAPDHTIYIGFGDNVYRGLATGSFSTIYTDRPDGSKLVAGSGGNVALISGGEIGEGSSDINSKKAPTPTPGLIVIQSGGTVLTKNIQPVSAAWSTGGQYLTVSTHDNSEVYDSSLHEVSTIPQNELGAPVWLDDNVLYYKIDDQLWSFNLANQKSQIIADMPLGDTIEQISISKDKNYVYASTDNDNSEMSLKRVGLHSQPIPQLAFNLQDILPQSNSDPGYSLGLYNFSGAPTVTLTPYPGAGADAELQTVKQQLQAQGFNLGSLQFLINQPATSQ